MNYRKWRQRKDPINLNVRRETSIDCDTLPGSGPAVDHVFEFAGDNDAFLEAYLEAWKIATENGFDDDELTRLIDGTGTWQTTTALVEEK